MDNYISYILVRSWFNHEHKDTKGKVNVKAKRLTCEIEMKSIQWIQNFPV